MITITRSPHQGGTMPCHATDGKVVVLPSQTARHDLTWRRESLHSACCDSPRSNTSCNSLPTQTFGPQRALTTDKHTFTLLRGGRSPRRNKSSSQLSSGVCTTEATDVQSGAMQSLASTAGALCAQYLRFGKRGLSIRPLTDSSFGCHLRRTAADKTPTAEVSGSPDRPSPRADSTRTGSTA